MNSSKQIKMGAFLSYLSVSINMITGLIYTPWMISSIGKANYGLYTLAMSVISLFIFDFGLGVSILRFLSKYLAEGRQDKADNCLGLVYKLYLYIDIILLFALSILYFFIPNIYQKLSSKEIEDFKVIYSIAALYTIVSFPFIPLNGILSAHEKFFQLKLSEIIHKFIVVGAMSICLICGYGLYALVSVNAFAGIVMIFLKIYFIKKYTVQGINFKYKEKSEFRSILGFSSWVTIMSICQRCIFILGPTILGICSGSSSIAIFGIASSIEGYVFSFSSAISGMFLPRVSRIVSKDGDILPLMIKIGRIQLIIVSLVVFGFIFVGNDFIYLWVGNSFSEAFICTMLIIIPSILQIPQEIGDQTLFAKNKIKHRCYAFIAMAAINILFGVPLSYYYGAKGLCASIMIAYLTRTIILNIIYKKILLIDISAFIKKTFLSFVPTFLLIGLLATITNSLLKIDGWSDLMIKIAIFISVYSICIYFMVMNKEEKQLIKQTLRIKNE